jgi:hypothetical protein
MVDRPTGMSYIKIKPDKVKSKTQPFNVSPKMQSSS